jgi:hypothetical protein
MTLSALSQSLNLCQRGIVRPSGEALSARCCARLPVLVKRTSICEAAGLGFEFLCASPSFCKAGSRLPLDDHSIRIDSPDFIDCR